MEELFILLTMIYKKWSGGGVGAYSVGFQMHRNTHPVYTLVPLGMKQRTNEKRFYKGVFEFQLFKRQETVRAESNFPPKYTSIFL